MTDPIDAIRETYADYDRTDRGRLWDLSNPGFARLVHDRDEAIVSLLRVAVRTVPSPRVIDIGCGDGGVALLVARAGLALDVTGVDLLSDRVERARQHAPGATFVEASSDALPFATGSFDVAVAMTLFSSLPDPGLEARSAAEIGRVLRPDGRLIWYDLRVDSPGNPAVHGIDRRRLAALFPDWALDIRSTTLAPPIARRLGRMTGLLYPILAAVPPLRSHLVGSLRCPT